MTRLLLACLLLTLPAPALAEALVYVLMGQSNMTGNAPVEQAWTINPNRIWVYRHSGKFLPGVAEPVHSGPYKYPVFDVNANLGPTLGIAETLSARHPHDTIIMLPCARAGTSIDGYARSTSTSTMYGACLARVNAIKTGRRIAGVIYHQGFGDAGSLARSSSWGQKFTDLVANLRADYGVPNLPVIFVKSREYSPACTTVNAQRGPYFSPGTCAEAGVSTVIEQQAAINLPRVQGIDPGALPLQSDCAHNTAAGYKRLGEILGNAMGNLKGASSRPGA